ncbi:hypothetical protein FHT00_000965 [Sphingomonas insulae]|uniref:GCN5-related N-acetyltransferase n=1 Tax=Sphingomonas insulae TaxID=424800 RepID=A0ABN1HSH6_9SPHN|nr:GCN5-related N-acetyltransferase [Sphingomonas insulae]NIJ29032.1 hypothetical protein [Sphingomonas insulae]
MAAGAGLDRDRAALEAEWLDLTRRVLPALAGARQWPIRADHCFQRVLLDTAVGDVWYDVVTKRPAYRFIATDFLAQAVDLGRSLAAGRGDLDGLNRQSLDWRRARKTRHLVD